MYAYIKGTLAIKKADRIIVEAGGIGYNIFYPVGRIALLPPTGSEITVYTYTSVREDAIWLYGFDSDDALDIFKDLISVSGVGPKAAMGLLSELSATQIRLAVISADIKALSKAPGVAKKTAERIILELKGKMGEISEEMLLSSGESIQPEDSGAQSPEASEAAEALMALGYPSADASAAVKHAIEEGAKGSEAVLKAALRYL